MSDTNGYDDLLQSLKEAAVGLKALSQQAANEYAPIVEHIIRTRSQDAADIKAYRCVSGEALAAGELRRATNEPAASASPLTEDLP